MSQSHVPPVVVEGTPQQPDDTGYRGNHPVAAFFHVLFKFAGILGFILFGLLSGSYVAGFIFVVLSTAADFWTVKNVSGRLLVGLRWWNEIKDDGTNEWIFESAADAAKVNSFDNYFFWITTMGYPLFWVVLLIFSSISRMPMPILGIVLGGANALGYVKCRKDAKKKVASFVASQAASNPGLVMQVARQSR